MKKKSTKKVVLKKAADLELNIKIVKPSGKVYFPEKLAKANEMISRLKNPLPS